MTPDAAFAGSWLGTWQHINLQCGPGFRTKSRSTTGTEDAAACPLQRCAHPKRMRASIQPALTSTHRSLYSISSSWDGTCKVYSSSCLVLLIQRPPKRISYQKHNFKAEEKTESKHLKAQMEADNYTQCSRKCHFTIREVCGGDDINTHSRISLPALLRSSWEAHSSAPRCLLKSPVFLCTSLTTALCGSLITLHIVKSELLAMLAKAGCKITPSPLS